MNEKVSKQLRDPTKAARYLNRALEYGDPDNLQEAFLDLVKAQGGYHRVAVRSRMNECRVKLIILDEEESWKLLRLYKLLQAMGVRLVAVGSKRALK